VVSLGESWNNNGGIDGLAFQIFQQSHGLLANPPFRSMIFPAINFHLVQGGPITMFDFNLSRKVGVKTICNKSLKINSQGFHKQMLWFFVWYLGDIPAGTGNFVDMVSSMGIYHIDRSKFRSQTSDSMDR
jgi:hypothetical protein